MRATVVAGLTALGLLVGFAPGAGAGTHAQSCPAAWQAGWIRLADKVQAPVYCPSWMPSPLDARIGDEGAREPPQGPEQPRARSAAGLMRLTRRRFLGGAAAAALGGGGVYELVDRLVSTPTRRVVEPAGMPAEQHVFDLGTVHSE